MTQPELRHTEATKEGYFVVDAVYLREQAREAFWTFLAPFTGVYGAGVRRGAKRRMARQRARKQGSSVK